MEKLFNLSVGFTTTATANEKVQAWDLSCT